MLDSGQSAEREQSRVGKGETLKCELLEKTSEIFHVKSRFWGIPILRQGGITCEAIDEPGKSSKAIDKRVIINFRDKNVVIARFRDKNVVIARFRDKNVVI